MLVLRTHDRNPTVDGLIADLSRAGPVVAAVDESAGVVDIPHVPKVALTPSWAHANGLYTEVTPLFWRCGDYALYAVRQAHPAAAYYWMIEPDVLIYLNMIGDFFNFFDDVCSADFLAARVRVAAPDWDWAATLRDRYPVVWQCLFPLVRLSAGAIDFLLDRRRKDTAMMDGRDPAAWPNDEAFTATTLAHHGYTLADFNQFGAHYTDASFSFWNPLRRAALLAQTADGLIYHPVLSGEHYFAKLLYVAYCRRDFSSLQRTVDELTGIEWSSTDARRYRQAIAAAISSIDGGVRNV